MTASDAATSPSDPFAHGIGLDEYPAGAAFVTELVNTVPGRRVPTDALTTVAELETLLRGHGATGTSDGLGAADLDAVRDVRDALLAVLQLDDEAAAVAALDALLDGPAHRVRLAPPGSAGTWSVAFPEPATVAERAQVIGAVALLAVIRALGVERFRSCASPACSGWYVDTSRPGRRRYCTPAICGNRENVAAYRARRRGAAGDLARADRPSG